MPTVLSSAIVQPTGSWWCSTTRVCMFCLYIFLLGERSPWFPHWDHPHQNWCFSTRRRMGFRSILLIAIPSSCHGKRKERIGFDAEKFTIVRKRQFPVAQAALAACGVSCLRHRRGGRVLVKEIRHASRATVFPPRVPGQRLSSRDPVDPSGGVCGIHRQSLRVPSEMQGVRGAF